MRKLLLVDLIIGYARYINKNEGKTNIYINGI